MTKKGSLRPCPMCAGTGKCKHLDGGKVRCPMCKGRKKVPANG